MCLKLTIKTPEQRCDVVLVFLLTLDTLHIFFQCFYFSSVFIDFEQEHVSWVNVYLNDLKVNRRIHLSTDVWGIIPICFVEKKNTPEKNPFMAATVRWSIKYFFAPNYPIFRKSLDKGKNKQENIFCDSESCLVKLIVVDNSKNFQELNYGKFCFSQHYRLTAGIFIK